MWSSQGLSSRWSVETGRAAGLRMPGPWEFRGALSWGGGSPGSRPPLFPPASDILSYYFLCNQAIANPFQQVRAAAGGPGGGGGAGAWGLDFGVLGEDEGARDPSPVSGGRSGLGAWTTGSSALSACVPAEADPVPASSGQHPLPAAGPGARSCAPVPFRAGRRCAHTGLPGKGRGQICGCGRGSPKGRVSGRGPETWAGPQKGRGTERACLVGVARVWAGPGGPVDERGPGLWAGPLRGRVGGRGRGWGVVINGSGRGLAVWAGPGGLGRWAWA